MRILIVSFSFPPNKDGVSVAAAVMARGFADRGWSVNVLTEMTTPARETLVWNQVQLTEYSQHTSESTDLRIQQFHGSYREFIISGGWDVVIFHAYLPPLHLALPFLDQISAKKILVSHGYAALLWIRYQKFPYGLGVWLRSVFGSLKMARWIRRFDRVVYLSEQADFKGFFDHWIAKVTCYHGRRVIPNGVDPTVKGADPASFRRRWGIENDRILLLCVANYSPRKDQGYGARAFRAAAIPGSVLVFIGSEFNEFSEAYQKQDAVNLSDNSSTKIIWLERQSREMTLDALAACDAFILSANHEAQPIALLEAMREGKPWIARQAGCIESMPGGLCVKTETEMSQAMIQLAFNPPLRTRLGNEGKRAVATRYNQKTYVDAYCNLVENLVSETK